MNDVYCSLFIKYITKQTKRNKTKKENRTEMLSNTKFKNILVDLVHLPTRELLNLSHVCSFCHCAAKSKLEKSTFRLNVLHSFSLSPLYILFIYFLICIYITINFGYFLLLVDKLLPTLTTGYYFNQPVDKLPPTLTHLTTGDWFYQPVYKLPPTLTHLRTGQTFYQLITSHPHSLTIGLSENVNVSPNYIKNKIQKHTTHTHTHDTQHTHHSPQVSPWYLLCILFLLLLGQFPLSAFISTPRPRG
jgi:hypothetical protein